jgi:hypothetical protein
MANRLSRDLTLARNRGAPLIGADPDDLVQHALECLLKGDPPLDRHSQDLFKWLCRRMSNKAKQIRRDRFENSTAHTASIDDDPIISTDMRIVALNEFRNRLEQIELGDFVRKFIEWLSRSPRHRDLVALTRIITIYGIVDVPDQARALNTTRSKIYELQRRVRHAMAQFQAEQAKMGRHK